MQLLFSTQLTGEPILPIDFIRLEGTLFHYLLLEQIF